MESVLKNIEKEYNATIKEVLLDKDRYILLLDFPVKERRNNNVIAIDNKGNLLWEIEKVMPEYEGDYPYTNIYFNENNKLEVSNWIGMEYLVDRSNGKITQAREGRPW